MAEDIEETAEAPAPGETVYSLSDLMNGSQTFDVMPEVVKGAMRRAGLEEATREQAAQAVRAYMDRRD